MNSREKLFFKDIKLHKSMSYINREEREMINKLRRQYIQKSLKEKEEKYKAKFNKKSIFEKIYLYIIK